MKDCVLNIVEASNGELTNEDALKIYERIQRKYNNPKWNPAFKAEMDRPVTAEDLKAYQAKLDAMTPEGKYQEAARAAFEEAIHEKREALRRQYLSSTALNKLLETLKREGGRKQGGCIVGHVAGLQNILVGDPKGRGEFESLEARINGTKMVYLSDLAPALEKYNAFFGMKVTNDGMLALAREIDKPGSSGDANAKALMDVWRTTSESMRQKLNNLGADVGMLADWGIPHYWDANAMRRFGLKGSDRRATMTPELLEKAKNNFIDAAMKHIDRERYTTDEGFAMDDTQMRATLAEIYKSISTNGLGETPSIAQGGSMGLAKAMSIKHRELHFKTAESWLEFNREAGEFDMLQTMMTHVDRTSREAALLEKFGPNPAHAFESAMEWAKHWDAEAGMRTEAINKKAFATEAVFEELSALNKDQGDLRLARVMADARRWMVASKLGYVLLSQVSDLSTYATIARADGFGMVDAIRFAVKSLAGMSKADKQLAMEQAVATHTMIADVSTRVGEAAMGTSFASRSANFTIRMSGMKWWTDAMQRAYQMLIGFHMAKVKGQGFDALDPRFQNMLKRHGIDGAAWDTIRQSETVNIGGAEILTPTTVRLLGKKTGQDLSNLEIKLAGMLHENSMVAVATPGAKQRAWFTEKTPAGTGGGELLRSFALFHSFTLSMMQKVLPRIMHAEGTSGFRAGLMAQFALGTIIAGAFSYQMKDIAKGRNPRSIYDAKFWLAAAAQGGGFGIFGDFVFADASRFGKSMATSLAGPLVGVGDDLYNLTIGNMHQQVSGKKAHWVAEGIQFAKNNAPFINLWYTRAIIDHLLLYSVQEAANPGYLRRMQNRLKSENRQTMYWNPGSRIPTQFPSMNELVK